jgi:hypothetical protein
MQDVLFIPNTLELQTRIWLKIISGRSNEADSSVGHLSHTAWFSELAVAVSPKPTNVLGTNKHMSATSGNQADLRELTCIIDGE